MTILRAFVAVTCTITATTEHLSAQERVRINGTPLCPSCTVQIVRTADVGDRDGPGIISDDARVRVSPSAIYVMDVITALGSVLVFNHDGTFRQKIGRQGKGPGEYTFPINVLTGSDGRVRILDLGGRRVTTLDSSFRYLTSVQAEAASAIATLLPDGRIVLGTNLSTRERAGYPMHVLDVSGRIERSFGADQPQVVPGLRLILPRLAPSRDGKVWAVTDQRVELWDAATGKRVLEIVRDQVAFWPTEKDRTVPASGVIRIERESSLHGVWEDEQRRLWVVIHVPVPNAVPLPNIPTEGGEMKPNRNNGRRLYDTIIEVWDLERRSVISRARSDERLLLAHDGYVTHYNERPDGTPFFRVYRLNLSTPAGRT